VFNTKEDEKPVIGAGDAMFEKGSAATTKNGLSVGAIPEDTEMMSADSCPGGDSVLLNSFDTAPASGAVDVPLWSDDGAPRDIYIQDPVPMKEESH
jgi:hypothetical protein